MREIFGVNRGDRGHVMAQLAACRRSVGLALLGQRGLFELRGSPAHLGAFGTELQLCEPMVGQPVQTGWGWWQRVTPRRALALVDPIQPVPLGRFLQRAAASHPDIALDGPGCEYVGLALAGPHAGDLAESPAGRLADPLMAVSEREDYRLLLLPADRARDTLDTLLAIGAGPGAVMVDPVVVELYRAARRASTRQQTGPRPQLHHAMNRTGVLFP